MEILHLEQHKVQRPLSEEGKSINEKNKMLNMKSYFQQNSESFTIKYSSIEYFNSYYLKKHFETQETVSVNAQTGTRANGRNIDI